MNITGTEITLSRDEDRASISTSLSSFELSVESTFDETNESLGQYSILNTKAEIHLRSLNSDSSQSGRWMTINEIDASLQVRYI